MILVIYWLGLQGAEEAQKVVQSEEDKVKAKAIAGSSVKSFGSSDHSSRIQEKGEALGKRAQTL